MYCEYSHAEPLHLQPEERGHRGCPEKAPPQDLFTCAILFRSVSWERQQNQMSRTWNPASLLSNFCSPWLWVLSVFYIQIPLFRYVFSRWRPYSGTLPMLRSLHDWAVEPFLFLLCDPGILEKCATPPLLYLKSSNFSRIHVYCLSCLQLYVSPGLFMHISLDTCKRFSTLASYWHHLGSFKNVDICVSSQILFNWTEL